MSNSQAGSTSNHDTAYQQIEDALWSDLAQRSWSEISLAAVAEDLLLDPVQVQLLAGSKTDIIIHKVTEIDKAALMQSHADFADDPDASMHEKLLEGLLCRFEHYQPHKRQMQNLHKASLRNPTLAAQLLGQLTKTMDKLLAICGDSQPSWQRQARIEGMTGIVLSVRRDWQDDDTPDLAKTTKLLDKRLQQAAEWAASLKLIS